MAKNMEQDYTGSEFVQDNSETGMLAGQDRIAREREDRRFYYIRQNPAMYEVVDAKLDHYRGLIAGIPQTNLSLTNSYHVAFGRKSRKRRKR